MYNRSMKGKILMKGLVRVVCGVAISAAYGAAVYGFFMTHRESGYLAVLDFMASMAALTVAVAGSYAMGNIGNRE